MDRLRDTTREHTQEFWEAVFGQDPTRRTDALSRAEATEVARVALEATGDELVLPATDGAEADRATDGGLTGPARTALLDHVRSMALDPTACGERAISALTEAGVRPAQIVGASQVATFAIFLSRLLRSHALLDEALNGTTESQPLPQAPVDGDELGHPRTEFPLMDWSGWVLARTVDSPGAPDDAKGASDYYGVLNHVPDLLALRTALYDAIMTGPGELDRADRELVALATSLETGCSFCASVHGRRLFALSRETGSGPLLKHHGPAALPTDRERALATLGAAVARTPVAVDSGHVAALLQAGLTPAEVMDAAAVAAMFTWANRLMLTLGEGTAKPRR
ncbi:peroxidase-related enzyme [Ornithinimicrobium cavernae]|uniref:peroxidase-related enzyme n=1 Tax=Ornithinimicrobium cavernae TaxID=2666047 RepID=UPI000D697F26|nr:peroxidase-related enzyme [Ornithinimicrobium cavernae]